MKGLPLCSLTPDPDAPLMTSRSATYCELGLNKFIIKVVINNTRSLLVIIKPHYYVIQYIIHHVILRNKSPDYLMM